MTPKDEVKEELESLKEFLDKQKQVSLKKTTVVDFELFPGLVPELKTLVFYYLGTSFILSLQSSLKKEKDKLEEEEKRRKNSVTEKTSELYKDLSLSSEQIQFFEEIKRQPFKPYVTALHAVQEKEKILQQLEYSAHPMMENLAAKHIINLHTLAKKHVRALTLVNYPHYNISELTLFILNPAQFLQENNPNSSIWSSFEYIFSKLLKIFSVMQTSFENNLTWEERRILYSAMSDLNVLYGIFTTRFPNKQYAQAIYMLELLPNFDGVLFSKMIELTNMFNEENFNLSVQLLIKVKRFYPFLFLEKNRSQDLYKMIQAKNFEAAVIFIEAGTPLSKDIQEVLEYALNRKNIWYNFAEKENDDFYQRSLPMLLGLLNRSDFQEKIQSEGIRLELLEKMIEISLKNPLLKLALVKTVSNPSFKFCSESKEVEQKMSPPPHKSAILSRLIDFPNSKYPMKEIIKFMVINSNLKEKGSDLGIGQNDLEGSDLGIGQIDLTYTA